MKSLLFACAAILMSCASTSSSQKSSDMQKTVELLVSQSQGGTNENGFRIIKDEKEYLAAANSGFQLVEEGKNPADNYPKFPKDKKVILYNLGSFRSGSHAINEIKNVFVKDNVLFVEVPNKESISGGMDIQVLSSPWFIFAVPANYQFTSVQLKYSK